MYSLSYRTCRVGVVGATSPKIWADETYRGQALCDLALIHQSQETYPEEYRITSREIVPTGRIFPSFFSAHDRSRTSFAIAFVCVSGNGKGVFLVVSRVRLLVKHPFFMLAVCWCDHVASSTCYLVPARAGLASFSKGRDKGGRDVREGGHHLVQECQVELLAEAEGAKAMPSVPGTFRSPSCLLIAIPFAQRAVPLPSGSGPPISAWL